MTKFTGYRCSICNTEYLPGQVTYTCPKDGGNLDIVLDYDAIRQKFQPEDLTSRAEDSLWRYLPLLPVPDPGGTGTPLRAAGWTPVFALPRLAEKLGLEHLWLKDESRNPTASFKDRASAVVVARAREIGAEVVVTASTGNAGAALAGMSAAGGQKAVIFAPKSAPPAKVAQLLVYGAKVILVDGTYDEAFDLTIQAEQWQATDKCSIASAKLVRDSDSTVLTSWQISRWDDGVYIFSQGILTPGEAHHIDVGIDLDHQYGCDPEADALYRISIPTVSNGVTVELPGTPVSDASPCESLKDFGGP